jgi:uncharacterized membrane protein YccC
MRPPRRIMRHFWRMMLGVGAGCVFVDREALGLARWHWVTNYGMLPASATH